MAKVLASPLSPHLPHVLTPSSPGTINQHTPIAPSPNSTVPKVPFTSRTWNIPPRPKPGRKPAGDAPPTKRKAQNREAQRAFRERRAARVGELEEQLKETQDDSRKENAELKETIQRQQNDIQYFINVVAERERRIAELEDDCRGERSQRQQVCLELDLLQEQVQEVKGHIGSQDQVYQSDRSLAQRGQNDISSEGITCGRCDDENGRCECIEEFLVPPGPGDGAQLKGKRTHSPFKDLDAKRARSSDIQSDFENNEIDFTAQFSSRKVRKIPSSSTNVASEHPNIPPDPCGFCNDGTECICAAVATEISQQQNATQQVGGSDQRLAASSVNEISNGCTQNPGNCAQCRVDPQSKVFCRTLAATRGTSTNNAASMVAEELSTEDTYSCADAFTRLSQHHGFPQARDDLGSWVSQLSAVPRTAKTQDKTAFEIEAASVMSVLKFFDKRFGQNPQNNGATPAIERR